MHVHGRAGKPKQLARYAKNPGKTRILQRRGQDSNNPQIPWETHTSTPRATRNTTRADFIVCDDSKNNPSRPTGNFFAARFTGSRIQDRSKFTGARFFVCRVIYRVTPKTPENLQGHRSGVPIAIHSAFQFVTTLRRGGWTQGNAEAAMEVPKKRPTFLAVRRLAKSGIARATATTAHAVRALPWSNRIADCTFGIITVPVATPLPDVPVHIV